MRQQYNSELMTTAVMTTWLSLDLILILRTIQWHQWSVALKGLLQLLSRKGRYGRALSYRLMAGAG